MVSYTSGDMKQQHNQNPGRTLKRPPNALGPQQPKVYKVKPIHFRELVQKLTGAPLETQSQPQQRRTSLQSVAPAPLQLLHRQQQQQQQQALQVKHDAEEQKPVLPDNKVGGEDGLTELTLSPNFQAWFSFAMLSPGMQQRSVL